MAAGSVLAWNCRPPRKNGNYFQGPLFAYRGPCFPRAGVSVWFLLGVGWLGLASRLINEPAVVAKPVSISPDNCWLSLAKSHFPLKSVVPTGSGF